MVKSSSVLYVCWKINKNEKKMKLTSAFLRVNLVLTLGRCLPHQFHSAHKCLSKGTTVCVGMPRTLPLPICRFDTQCAQCSYTNKPQNHQAAAGSWRMSNYCARWKPQYGKRRGVLENGWEALTERRRECSGDSFDSLRLFNPPIVAAYYQTFYCTQCPLAPCVINPDLKCFSLLLLQR